MNTESILELIAIKRSGEYLIENVANLLNACPLFSSHACYQKAFLPVLDYRLLLVLHRATPFESARTQKGTTGECSTGLEFLFGNERRKGNGICLHEVSTWLVCACDQRYHLHHRRQPLSSSSCGRWCSMRGILSLRTWSWRPLQWKFPLLCDPSCAFLVWASPSSRLEKEGFVPFLRYSSHFGLFVYVVKQLCKIS